MLPVAVTVPSSDFDPDVTATDVTGEPLTLAEGSGGGGVSTQCVGPPTEVSPPGAEQPLIFEDRTTLRWEDGFASNADTFNLYRGEIASLAGGDYGTCFLSDLVSPTAEDGADPPSGVGWTYLVSGENSAGEGVLGNDSFGALRPNATPCP